MSSTPRKVLLVAPAWVGDMVMADSLIQLLHEQRRGLEVHVVAPPATAPLAERLQGVARTWLLQSGHGELGLGRRRQLGLALRGQGFEQAIVLPNTWKSTLVAWWAKVPRRTGWHGESRFGVLNDRRLLDESRYPLMIERFMALGLDPDADLPAPYPLPSLHVDEDNQRRLCREFGLHGGAPVVALCPGAEFGPAKRWPAAHYAALARHALAQGRHVWLMGSAAEQSVCEGICALAPGAINLAGKTRLLDAVDLLAAADTVVCNDSGLMHIAGAVGTRVVALFGSTSPDFTPPLGSGAGQAGEPAVLSLALPCSPCFKRACPLGHHRCLRDLTPAHVLEVL
jgi:heptosyltransferase II